MSLPRNRFVSMLFHWLPMVYMVSGLIVILAFLNLIALAAGLVLIGVAGVEHLRQKALRHPHGNREAGASQMPGRMDSRLGGDTEGPPTQAQMQLAWSESFECGHPLIDQQHKRLFLIGGKLINAVLKNKAKDVVEGLLDEFTEHIQHHFATEEAVLERTRFPLNDEHKAQHCDLLQRAHALRDRYRDGEIDANALVGFIAYDMIAEHIIQSDRKFALR